MNIHVHGDPFSCNLVFGVLFSVLLCVSFSLKMGGGVQVSLSMNTLLLFIVGTCLLVVIINCVLMSKVFFF